MYIDISIDEILKKFVDNYEEKEIIGWTATAAGNGIHIEYEDKVLTWKDYEAIASDIYDSYFDDNKDVEPIMKINMILQFLWKLKIVLEKNINILLKMKEQKL